jgi:hypothetical protein
VLDLGGRPVVGDALSGQARVETEDGLDLGQRHLELAKRRHETSLAELIGPVEAVTGGRIDPGRHQQSHLAVEPQRLGRQPGTPGELSDAQ